MSPDVEAVVAAAFREEWGRVVATLIRVTGDWDVAEECAQDAFALALERWPRDGVPRNPGAWLTTTARNRAIDRPAGRRRARRSSGRSPCSRRETIRSIRTHRAIDDSGIDDDRLRLIFTCCHPALAVDAQVALTLRTLGGLTTAEIGRAFLVPEPTMAQRLVRAKRKIRNAGDPLPRAARRTCCPSARPRCSRCSTCCSTRATRRRRAPTCSARVSAPRRSGSARTLVELMPDEPEAVGLLALMLLHDARRAARVDGDGDLVPLEDQDRTPVGRATRSRRPSQLLEARAAAQPARPVPGAGGDRRVPRHRAATPPRPTGTRSPGSTASSPR